MTRRTEHCTRLRQGSWFEAKVRLRPLRACGYLEGARSLFPPGSLVWEPTFTVEVVDTWYAQYVSADQLVRIPSGWSLYDAGFALAHEAGHAFDHQLLTDTDRLRFCEWSCQGLVDT
jgi:hypothetical protein